MNDKPTSIDASGPAITAPATGAAAAASVPFAAPTRVKIAETQQPAGLPLDTSPLLIGVSSALIGAASALVVATIREYWNRGKAKRERAQSENDIYRRYLAPLCDACEKIVWRAEEIFIGRRHAYLLTETLPLDFNSYKRTSTLYRIATLIGWIRGMTLELRALPTARKGKGVPIVEQIAAFQKALADGPHVEEHRLASMAELWAIDLSDLDAAQRADLAMRFEIEAHRVTEGQLKSPGAPVRDMPAKARQAVCKSLIEFLTTEAGTPRRVGTLEPAQTGQAIKALGYREALLYRDWQDALGDAMIEPDPHSERRFRIIGYEEFSAKLETDTPWFRVFKTSIDDIDLTNPDPLDVRARQMGEISAAVAAILVAVAATDHADLVGTKTLGAANGLVAALSLPPGPPAITSAGANGVEGGVNGGVVNGIGIGARRAPGVPR